VNSLRRAGAALVSVAAAALGVWSVAAYRPAQAGSPAAVAPAQQVVLSSVSGLGISGTLIRQTEAWQPQAGGSVPAQDAAACPGQESSWTDNSQRPTVYVDIVVARCTSLETARDLQWNSVKMAAAGLGTVSLTPVVPGAYQGQGSPVIEWPAGAVQEVIFRRGGYYVTVIAYVASSRGGDASGVVRRVAAAQSRQLTGTPGTGAPSFRTLVLSGLLSSAVILTVLILAGRLLAGCIRRRLRKLPARTPGHPTAADLSVAARKVNRASRLANGLWLAAACSAAVYLEHQSGQAAFLIAAALALSGGWAARRPARLLRPGGHQLPGRAEVGWAVLIAAAAATSALSLTVAMSMGDQSLATVKGRIDPSIVSDEPLWRWTAGLPLNLVIGDFWAIAALLVLAASWCLGQARRSGRQDGAVVGGPLAAFAVGPERLSLQTSALGRAILAERLSLRQFEDFRIVAGRLLGRAGQARLIAVNAVPPGSYRPTEPELASFAARLRLTDLLLVFPPVPSAEIRARWEIFRARNEQFLPSRGDVDVMTRHADRMLTARWIPGVGWRCWQADVKSEAAYALAFQQAAVRGAAAAARSADPEFSAVSPSMSSSAPQALSAFSAGQLYPASTVAASGPARHRPRHGKPAASRARALLRPRGWQLMLGSGVLLALVVLNVIASLDTAPGPFNVKTASAEYMLPAGAVGDGLVQVSDSTKPTSELALLEKNGTRCAQRRRVWRPEHDTIRLDVALTVCSGPGILEDLQSAGADGAQSAHIAVADSSSIPYASDTDIAITLNGTAERARTITFRAGPVLTDVILYYPGNAAGPTAAQVKLLNDTARAELAELPYQAGPGYDSIFNRSLGSQIQHWVIDGLLLIIAPLSLWSWWTKRRHLARGEGGKPQPTDRLATVSVTRRARLAAWVARTRFTLQLAGIIALVDSLIVPSGRLWYLLVAVVLLAISLAIRSRRLHRRWSVRRRFGVLTGHRTAQAAALAALSAAAAVASVFFAACWLVALFLRSSVAVMPSGRLDISLLASGSPYRFLTMEPVTVLVVDFFALAVMAAILAPMSYTAARRVAALSAEEAVKSVPLNGASEHGPVLYLRNFTDDDIRMPTSRLSRNTLVERIAVYRLERFEEVIVRHLSEVGPVIAVNPPGAEKAPIGAARMNLANADWRASVRQYIGSARLIVVGAAPEGPTEGLAWELGEIARAGALDRTLLVLPPLRSQTVQDRWAVFAAMAAGFGLPPELAVGADRHLVLVREPQPANGAARWCTWHTRRRTEWAYAVALRDASGTLLGRPGNRYLRLAPAGQMRSTSRPAPSA